MLFSTNLFAALLAVAAIGVTGSPVELQKRDYIASVGYCRTYDDSSQNRCSGNGDVENWQCYQTNGIYWLNTFSISAADGTGGVVCSMFSDFNCNDIVTGGIYSPDGTETLGAQQIRSYQCTYGSPANTFGPP